MRNGVLAEVIAPDDELYRRLAPDCVTQGQVNSNAYKKGGKPDKSISVDLARLTSPAQSLASRSTFGLGILVARVPLDLGFDVRHAPIPGNDAHSLIEGENTKELCRRLAEATQIHTAPQPNTD